MLSFPLVSLGLLPSGQGAPPPSPSLLPAYQINGRKGTTTYCVLSSSSLVCFSRTYPLPQFSFPWLAPLFSCLLGAANFRIYICMYPPRTHPHPKAHAYPFPTHLDPARRTLLISLGTFYLNAVASCPPLPRAAVRRRQQARGAPKLQHRRRRRCAPRGAPAAVTTSSTIILARMHIYAPAMCTRVCIHTHVSVNERFGNDAHTFVCGRCKVSRAGINRVRGGAASLASAAPCAAGSRQRAREPGGTACAAAPPSGLINPKRHQCVA